MHESLSNFGSANCDSSALECRLLTLSNAACHACIIMMTIVQVNTAMLGNPSFWFRSLLHACIAIHINTSVHWGSDTYHCCMSCLHALQYRWNLQCTGTQAPALPSKRAWLMTWRLMSYQLPWGQPSDCLQGTATIVSQSMASLQSLRRST